MSPRAVPRPPYPFYCKLLAYKPSKWELLIFPVPLPYTSLRFAVRVRKFPLFGGSAANRTGGVWPIHSFNPFSILYPKLYTLDILYVKMVNETSKARKVTPKMEITVYIYFIMHFILYFTNKHLIHVCPMIIYLQSMFKIGKPSKR